MMLETFNPSNTDAFQMRIPLSSLSPVSSTDTANYKINLLFVY